MWWMENCEGWEKQMNKWINEDWAFDIAVINGEPRQCRMGLETDDMFTCQYECPGGFCQKTLPVLHTLCEIARCGGDYTLRGSAHKHEIDFPCADGVITFRLSARQEVVSQ